MSEELELTHGERAQKTFIMVINGATFANVKKTLKYQSISEVKKDFAAMLIENGNQAHVEEKKQIASLQFDSIYRQLMAIANNTSMKPADRTRALLGAATVLSRKHTFEGIDSPQKHVHHLTRGAAAELDAFIADLAAARQESYPQEKDVMPILDADVISDEL